MPEVISRAAIRLLGSYCPRRESGNTRSTSPATSPDRRSPVEVNDARTTFSTAANTCSPPATPKGLGAGLFFPDRPLNGEPPAKVLSRREQHWHEEPPAPRPQHQGELPGPARFEECRKRLERLFRCSAHTARSGSRSGPCRPPGRLATSPTIHSLAPASGSTAVRRGVPKGPET